jgi:hypothetical protein
MKINTKYPITVLSKWTRFLGVPLCAGLLVALMVPAVAVSQYSNPAPVDLGAAGNFRILAKTGISTTGTTHITGDIGVSPAFASAITGFGLTAAGDHSTSSLVTGNIYAADYAVPTPANLDTAVLNMEAAYTNAAGRPSPDTTELGAGDITGMTLTHGLYKWGTGVGVSPAGVTISGNATDVWIFQIGQDLTVANGATVTLGGAAKASNIFWQVAGNVSLGTTAAMKGIILCQTAIVIQNLATLEGRALAQTAVTLDANTVLPVELAAFTATANRMNADLHWSTATEVNNYGFEIERRQTETWAKVGFVSGAGTSNAPRDYSYTDNNLPAGRYAYRIKQVDNNGAFSYHGSVEVEIGLAPQEFALLQNYPNPFNPSTKIQYSLAKPSQVSLKVYNVLGLEVATLVNGRQETGSYTVPFGINTGTLGLSSGVYFYRLEAGSFVSTKKLVLMK